MMIKLKDQTNISYTLQAYYMWFYLEAERLKNESMNDSYRNIGQDLKLSKFAPNNNNED